MNWLDARTRSRLETLRRRLYDLALLLFVLIAAVAIVAVGGVLLVRWPGELTPTYQTFLTDSLIPLATLILAIPTAWTVQQNRFANRELRRDREKPIAVDEIRSVLNPAIADLKQSLDHIEEVGDSPKFSWYYSRGSDRPHDTTVPGTVFPWLESTHDRAALQYFREDDPTLFAQMERQDRLVERASTTADEIAAVVRPRIEAYVDAHDVRNREGKRPDLDDLTAAVVHRTDAYGEEHPDHEVWAAHRDDLIAVLDDHAAEAHDRLLDEEAAVIDHSETLLESLYGRRMRLRRRHGISSSEVTDA